MAQENKNQVVRLTEAINFYKKIGNIPFVWELKRLQVEYGNVFTVLQNKKIEWPELGFDSSSKRVVFA